MKKKFLLSLASLFVFGFSFFSLAIMPGNATEMYFLSIEALTQGEEHEWGCGGNVTYIPNETLRSDICITGGTHLKCKPQDNVCCDPSGQTDCPKIDIDII